MPSPIVVSATVPRSMQEFAPTSTSSPIDDRAERVDADVLLLLARGDRAGGAGLLDDAGRRGDEGEAVGAEHRAGLGDEAVADADPRADPHALEEQRVVADHGVLGDRDVAEDAGAGRRSAPGRRSTTKGPTAAPAPMSAVGSMTALGWMPGAISGRALEDAADAGEDVARRAARGSPPRGRAPASRPRARGSRRGPGPCARSSAKAGCIARAISSGPARRRLGGTGDGQGGVADAPRRRARAARSAMVITGGLPRAGRSPRPL